jgi:hypothetical protein
MSYEKVNGGPFRNGRVVAGDVRFTGEEPIWTDAASWDKDKFLDTRARAMRFYNYYLATTDIKPSLLEWMVRNGYSTQDISAISGAPTFVPDMTVCKLARCILRGMPAVNAVAGTDDDQFIRSRLSDALGEIARGTYSSKTVKDKDKPVANPTARLKQKVMNTVVGDLDQMLDKWIEARDRVVEPLSLYSVLDSYDTAPQGCAHVTEWLNRHLDEMKEAAEGKDEQLTEAYSHLSKKALKSRIEGLEKMKTDIVTYVAGKKALRKPRAKKTKPAEKQVSKIKFLPSSQEYSISSVSPLLIPGANRLIVFNVKYKTLAYYVASGPTGLSVKGTSIKGFDEAASFVQGLRKPQVVLPIVLGKTVLQMEKALNQLTTKRRKANGRVNEDTVLLRVIDTK